MNEKERKEAWQKAGKRKRGRERMEGRNRVQAYCTSLCTTRKIPQTHSASNRRVLDGQDSSSRLNLHSKGTKDSQQSSPWLPRIKPAGAQALAFDQVRCPCCQRSFPFSLTPANFCFLQLEHWKSPKLKTI